MGLSWTLKRHQFEMRKSGVLPDFASVDLLHDMHLKYARTAWNGPFLLTRPWPPGLLLSPANGAHGLSVLMR